MSDTDSNSTDGTGTQAYWNVVVRMDGRNVKGRYDNPEAAIEHARAITELDDGREFEIEDDPIENYSPWRAYCEEDGLLVSVDRWNLSSEFGGLDAAWQNEDADYATISDEAGDDDE